METVGVGVEHMSRYVENRVGASTMEGSAVPELTLEAYAVGLPRRTWLVREDQDRWPLVADKQFILATRDTGYRSTAAAVSELIDNALQAGATTVHVLVREDREGADRESGVQRRRVSLAVLDNGSGMDAAGLRTALQFGGSERFNDRSGAGRFGMGLPNSSVSQSPRLEVYSWRGGEGPLYSYLDVQEIARGAMREVPAPSAQELPAWVCAAVESAGDSVPSSGTLVFWPECDRLPYRKASTVRAKLGEALGRTYRYALREGRRLFIDGRPIEAVDPLMEWGRAVEQHGTATPYGDELCYEFKVPTAPDRTSVVRVRFTVLPVRRWARLPLDVRRELGIIGGAGVSVVRAGREVDYGWHLMGAKRRENYDDWWRCEVRFEPELDEYFGVTHSKQEITPHPVLQDVLASDLEQIARTLNARVRSEFLRVATGCGTRAVASQQELAEDSQVLQSNAIRAACERERFLPPLEKRIRRFRIEHTPVASPRFFAVDLQRGDVVLTLNTDHPVYASIDGGVSEASRQLLDLFLLAAARAEVAVRSRDEARSAVQPGGATDATDALDYFLEAWSDALAAYLSGRT